MEQAQIAKQVALIAKLREQETAEIMKKQTMEVAERSKEVAVAEKERNGRRLRRRCSPPKPSVKRRSRKSSPSR